jgi:hypothetical protein
MRNGFAMQKFFSNTCGVNDTACTVHAVSLTPHAKYDTTRRAQISGPQTPGFPPFYITNAGFNPVLNRYLASGDVGPVPVSTSVADPGWFIPDPDPTIAPSRIRIPDPGSGG